MTTSTITPDLQDLLNTIEYPWHLSRWGVPTITTPDESYNIRIAEVDGTYYLTVLSGGRAELIHTEARFSGVAAQAALLATLDALIAELA